MANWNRKKDNQMGSRSSYALLLVVFVCVVFLGVVFAITETQKHIYDPAQTPAPLLKNIIGEIMQKDKPSPEELEAIRESMNYWPFDEFPSIPQYDASRYQTTVENRLATIVLPAEDGAGLAEYIDSLLRSGASLLVDSNDFTALIQAGCEMHILSSGAAPYIKLCGEPAISLKGQELPERLPLPKAGRPVALTYSGTSSTYTFIYRNASISDALQYLNELIADDWQSVHRISKKDNTFYATYKKGDEQLAVDYFTDGDYKISFKAP